MIRQKTLNISHGRTAGFFSNCSVRLKKIIEFLKVENEPPERIDSSKQFRNYKENINDATEDFAKYFFKEKEAKTVFEMCEFGLNHSQYQKYKELEFDKLNPLVETFFSPSVAIQSIAQTLESKYSIDHENTCAVYYRGNDKVIETELADYGQFFSKAKEILQNNPRIKFLIQTDELEFAEKFKQEFPNSFWFDELSMINHNLESSVHHSLPRNQRKEHASYFLAAIIVMSKTKHLITYSGNCGLWTVLYRGHAKNVHQYLKTKNRKTQKIGKDFGWV
jgi:hypothetical protein